MMTHPYASRLYAAAVAADVVHWREADRWLVRRAIAAGGGHDGAGPYPLTPLPVHEVGFDSLREARLVSLVLVTDPFFAPPLAALTRMFDHTAPFKTHHVYDPRAPFRYDKHHRYEVKRARRHVKTAIVPYRDVSDTFGRLYGVLCDRHDIRGVQAFSSRTFAALAAVDGLVAVVAKDERGEIVSMHLWMKHESRLYSHLAASSERGYELRAAYAINDFVIDAFGSDHTIDFGGGAGIAESEAEGSGLARFKRGFTNTTLPCHLCGKILDAGAYASLVAGAPAAAYFPRYRAPTQTPAPPRAT